MKTGLFSLFKTTWAVITLLVVSVSMLQVINVRAAGTIRVNSTVDSLANDGVCTLREAIISANKDKSSGSKAGECAAGRGDDVIILAPGTYSLTRSSSGSEDSSSTGDLDISSNIVIQVSGSGQAEIVGVNLNDRILHILSGNVTISNVSIRGGTISESGGGSGGGIANFSSLTLRDVYIYNNTATSNGGGIYNAAGANLTIHSSTIAANKAERSGGGLANQGTTTLTNATLSSNTSQISGGGIMSDGSTTLNAVTITGNQTTGSGGNGGGISIAGGSSSIKNSILASNRSLAVSPHPDCSGTVNSFGYNLFQSTLGCTLGGDLTGNLTGLDPLLVPVLANNGGPTPTHALLDGSPAVEAGTCSTTTGLILSTDQRGTARPQGLTCDMGAFEAPDPGQPGPVFTVNTVLDGPSTTCTLTDCSLRSAILAANTKPNGSQPDKINFNLSGTGLRIIQLTSPLPAVTEPLHIDGFSQAGASRNTLEQGSNAVRVVELNGAGAGSAASGVSVNASNSIVEGLIIQGFSGDGIRLSGSNNRISENALFNNGEAGVRVVSDSGNTLTENLIFGNKAGGIFLAAGTNSNQLAPEVALSFTRIADAFPTSDVGGILYGIPNTDYRIELFSNPACAGAQGQVFLGSAVATTGASGRATFLANYSPAISVGQGLTGTATGPDGSTSTFSNCSPAQALNDSWLTAQPLSYSFQGGKAVASTSQILYMDGQSRWFKVPVSPGGKLTLTVSGIPGSLVTLHRDLLKTYFQLESPESAAVLAASDLPGGYLPGGYLPGGYLPGGYLPGGYLPGGYLPGGYLPGGYLPGGYLPGGYLPGGYLPGGYLPGGYLPGGYLPADFLPGGYLPGGYLPELYSGAIRRSLMAISYDFGNALHEIERNTWDLDEDVYIQITGPAALASAFSLQFVQENGLCTNVPSLPAPGPNNPVLAGSLPGNSGLETLMLWDSTRMAASSTAADIQVLRTRLSEFAARPEIRGAVIDLASSQYPRVAQAHQIADANLGCISSKNAVATEIKRVVDVYRAANVSNGSTTLKYIVLAGSDYEIPFFRYPDQAGLANENEYIPPVAFQSASEASLRSGQVLGQDAYGARYEVTRSGFTLPVPDLAVGRLVRTASQVIGLLDAYVQSGGEINPQSALVTGYDFVADAASAIKSELENGLAAGSPLAFLYQPQEAGLEGAWTANDLRQNLMPASGSAADFIFFAGHFSAGGVLAADYETSIYTSEFASSPVDFTNSLILALGCHSGYNIPGPDALPFSPLPDWPEAFAMKQATYVAATGYAYGDTELTEYGERLFLELVQKLRTGSGSIPLGRALVDSKLAYMSQRVSPEGIDDKTLLETVLYGLPMMKVNMGGERIQNGQPSIVAATTPVSTGPGASLGLQIGQPAGGGQNNLVRVSPQLTRHDVPLTNILNNAPVNATYFTGTNGGVVARPAEPVFPLEDVNIASQNMILRGAGFRGGSYIELPGITPLTSAATTENSRSHPAFFSDTFYPLQNWGANYIGTISGGHDRLLVTPAQYRSSSLESTEGTLRTYQSMDFRLYYLNKNWATSSNTLLKAAAVAAAPEISTITFEETAPGVVRFQASVRSDPAAGVQDVWVTYTSTSGVLYGRWQSLDLSQDSGNSLLWSGNLSLPQGTLPADLRFVVQAANGAGSVSLVDPALRPTSGAATELEFLLSPPTKVAYDTPINLQVRLTSAGSPLAGRLVQASLSGQARAALTDQSGTAVFSLPALALPGEHRLQVSFMGAAGYKASSISRDIEVTRQTTRIHLDPVNASGRASQERLVTATLYDGQNQPVREKTLLFVVKNSSGTNVYIQAAITNHMGQAGLGGLPLPPGSYALTVSYGIFLNENGEQADLSYDTYQSSQASGILDLSNTEPTAVDDIYSTTEDTSLVVPAPGVLLNDSDPDGDSLNAVLNTEPSHGLVILNLDGSFSYTPNTNYFGQDTFTYKASDGSGSSEPAVVTINISPVNDAPQALPDSYDAVEDTPLTVAAPGVLENDSDPDGDMLEARLSSGPSSGSLVLNSDGSFTYTPNPDFFGTDSFSYTSFDGSLDSEPAVVSLLVAGAPDAPQAADDNVMTLEDVPITISVLENDLDPDGDPLTVVAVGTPANGTAVTNGITVTYTPQAYFNGSDSFTYTISDGTFTATGVVWVEVTPVNNNPECSQAQSSIGGWIWPPNNSIFFAVQILNVTDVDGDKVSITIDAVYQDESVSLGGFIPDARGIGTDTAHLRAERNGELNGRVYHIYFTARDGNGGSCSVDISSGHGVRVGVSGNQGAGLDPIDEGPLYDSTVAD